MTAYRTRKALRRALLVGGYAFVLVRELRMAVRNSEKQGRRVSQLRADARSIPLE
jgi:hypothetical protein